MAWIKRAGLSPETTESRRLRRKLTTTVIAVIVSLLVAVTVTYAWYIYNANRHITDVKMAAGTGVTFLISDSYDGEYKTNAGLSFSGLLNPVSTDQIRTTTINGVTKGGFQKVKVFTQGGAGQAPWLASIFDSAEASDFYKTSLFFCTNSASLDVYLADISYTDPDSANPISTALRVGFVVHTPGKDQPDVSECIFELSSASNPQAQYNTQYGQDGYVLDSSKTDGSTVPFTPLNSDNYCVYDSQTKAVTLKADSEKICTLPSAEDGADLSTPVQVDVYVWLEGCDADCTINLCNTALQSLALQFGGVRAS